MKFPDPVVAYAARNNMEVHMVCNLLIDAGVEAYAVEDRAPGGMWIGGTNSQFHKPQVWINRPDIERARPVLMEYDRKLAMRKLRDAPPGGVEDSGPPILVLCEECGESSEFPSVQKGTVQNCPRCLAFVDVGEVMDIEGWDDEPAEDDVPPEEDDDAA